jgi:hypothetical protein
MVKIKILEKPPLKPTKMICDNVIDNKLTEYPMIKEAFSTTSFNIILGKMEQGKTSLFTSFLNNKNIFKKSFHSIYVFMPSNSRQSIEDDIFEKYLPKEQLYDNLSVENLTEVYNQLKKDSKEGCFSLLLIDDFGASLKDPDILDMLKKIITKMRHLRCSIFILQQNWQQMPKQLRELVSNVITFNIGKSQLEKLFNEAIQLHKDKYQEIIDTCFIDPHDWLLINLHKSRSIYRNMDLVVLE